MSDIDEVDCKLRPGQIYHGDSRLLLDRVEPESIALSVWSPPYFVGKSYEKNLTYEQWCDLLATVITKHYRVLKPGSFLAINLADILCFPDPEMPRVMAENIGGHRLPVTRTDVERVQRENPGFNRHQVAKVLGVSEQTVDRRMKNNNIRGGKYSTQTRVKLTGPVIEQAAYEAGLYLYDRRVWVKDAAWENSQWHTNSYRAVDEFEYLFVFWKPGITTVRRSRLGRKDWAEWGSRGVWSIRSVRRNDDHEAKFPIELPERIIRLLTEPGDLVLDPFVGSGTTAVAAINTGRSYIGMEIQNRYVELARESCKTAAENHHQNHHQNHRQKHVAVCD